MPAPALNHLRFVAVGQDDPLAEPLLAELAVEYASRYDSTADAVGAWLRQYPAGEFVAGYRRIYLTTGNRQPEAEALYLATGYRRLAEPLPAEGEVYPVAFAKDLS
jgi:hypothetical protein